MNRQPEPPWRQYLRFFLVAGPAICGWFFAGLFVLPKLAKTWESLDGFWKNGDIATLATVSQGILGNFGAGAAFIAFLLISGEVIARSRPAIRPWVLDGLACLINALVIIGLVLMAMWGFLIGNLPGPGPGH